MLRVNQRRGKKFFLFKPVSTFAQVQNKGPLIYFKQVKSETSTSGQAAAREKFTRPSKKRQQQRTTAWGNDQIKQFDMVRKDDGVIYSFSDVPFACMSCFMYFSVLSSCL